MSSLAQQTLLRLLRAYQSSFSPDHSWLKQWHPHGFCRFYPSCSQYAYDSIERYGAFKGTGLAVQRILRCNPWHRGGFDGVK